jgi:hypothetical protein
MTCNHHPRSLVFGSEPVYESYQSLTVDLLLGHLLTYHSLGPLGTVCAGKVVVAPRVIGTSTRRCHGLILPKRLLHCTDRGAMVPTMSLAAF